ncbi:DUF2306 domain-containing protein [Maritalea porphyrae]|uniref:DUF2306 domain-containing protein n=1 Tax=Maritalea porphyrae TaxID=880732 RepID=UPI0022AF2D74|nr:DUF2306 domain-containing protein [Maritalea porphyrae]MCZ4271882.1 DUF2306 domain-containing protein [Maritalea porphyrae]
MKLSIFFETPIAVQIHMICAVSCLFLGLYMLLSKKGTKHHKQVGWVWVLLMLATATSATFIHQLRMIWIFSPIHIFVPVTFIGLFSGIRHARAGRIAAHRASMRSMYWGALCIPFAFALLPDRVLAYMFGTRDLEWFPMALVAAIVLGVGAYYRWEPFWKKSIQRLLSAN